MLNSAPMRSASVLLALTLASSALAEERFAVIIGSNTGWSNDRPLRHAEADAERVRAVLTELGGFAPDRVELMRDPDTAEVRGKLRRLADTLRAVGSDALVVFYYSGHADDRHLHLRGAPMSFDELYGSLRDLPAAVRLGVLDACRSGSILAAKGAAPTAPFAVRVEEPVRGVAFLTSSGADELSQETRALAGSVFTHHLVSGLRGPADSNSDGEVTLSEVYRYAYERTEADTATSLVHQRPAFRYELKGQGDVVLSRPARAVATLLLPKGEERRYVVVDPHEWQLFAEGRSSSAREVALALLPGDYQVKRVLPEQIEVAMVSLAPGAQVKAGALSYASRPLSAGVVKGQPDASDPAEAREYRRGKGLELLAAGEAGPALDIFDELLKAKPDDWPSLRGRARALIRVAEAYERVGDHDNELRSLKRALVADSSLPSDPDFQNWYRRLAELEVVQRREAAIRDMVNEEVKRNPRVTRTWGLGFDLVSTRGLAVVSGSLLLKKMLFLSVGVDLPGPGLDVSAQLAPFGWTFSPFVGLGGHLAFSKLGLGRPTPLTVNDKPVAYQDLWGNALHLDAGVQYFGSLGFSAELGLGVMLFASPTTGEFTAMAMPILSVAWYF